MKAFRENKASKGTKVSKDLLMELKDTKDFKGILE